MKMVNDEDFLYFALISQCDIPISKTSFVSAIKTVASVVRIGLNHVNHLVRFGNVF